MSMQEIPDDGKVIVQRYPTQYTVVGPQTMVMDINEAANSLVMSSFMRPWLAAQIKEALRHGVTFKNVKDLSNGNVEGWRGRRDGLVSEYTLASEEQLLRLDSTTSIRISQDGEPVPEKRSASLYKVVYKTAETVDAYNGLPRQAKVIVDVIYESGKSSVDEVDITILLKASIEKLRTKQLVETVFGFYRKRLVEEGHLAKICST